MNCNYEQCSICKRYFEQKGIHELNFFQGLGKVCDNCSIKILEEKKEHEN